MNLEVNCSELAIIKMAVHAFERELIDAIESRRVNDTAATVLSRSWESARSVKSKIKSMEEDAK